MGQLEHVELREIDYDPAVFDSVGPAPSPLAVAAGTVDVGCVSEVPVLRGRRGLLRRGSVEELEALGVEGLRDDGVRVMRRQLPLWEAWVLSSGVGARGGRTAWNM
jgi:hypothetical protein